MFKNLIFVILLIVPIISFAQDKPLVVSTASMIWDIAKNISGDHVEHELIVPIGGDPHIYEPTPANAALVTRANLVLKNGLTFEGWLTELIDNSGTEAKSITVTDRIKPIESLTYKGSTDPHAWMDVSLGIQYANNIKNALVELDPVHKADYEKRHAAYTAKLEGLDQYIMEAIGSIPADKRVLITSHDAFQYFGKRYKIKLEAILGTSTDAEVQTSDIIRVSNIIKEKGIPAIFVESTINPKLLKQIAHDNGAIIGGELFADSIGSEDSGGNSYYKMMKHNADVIVAALSKIKKGDEVMAEENPNKFNLPIIGVIALLAIGGFLIVARNLKT